MTNGRYANGSEFSPTARYRSFALREWSSWRRLRWHLAALAIAILLLGYLGPFGTFDQRPFGERMAYWALAVSGNWLLAMAFILTARAWLSGRVPTIVCIVAGSLAASVPGALTVAAIEWLFTRTWPEMLATGELFFATALVHLAIGLIVWGAIERPMRRGVGVPFPEQATVEPSAAPGAGSAGAPRILERLPADRRGALLHLRMRDHYVEVHTDRGMELVLMRFGDALEELGDTPGMQVHRSHWIARTAVSKADRRGGRTVLHLTNGAEVPVSRRFAKAFRQARWV